MMSLLRVLAGFALLAATPLMTQRNFAAFEVGDATVVAGEVHTSTLLSADRLEYLVTVRTGTTAATAHAATHLAFNELARLFGAGQLTLLDATEEQLHPSPKAYRIPFSGAVRIIVPAPLTDAVVDETNQRITRALAQIRSEDQLSADIALVEPGLNSCDPLRAADLADANAQISDTIDAFGRSVDTTPPVSWLPVPQHTVLSPLCGSDQHVAIDNIFFLGYVSPAIVTIDELSYARRTTFRTLPPAPSIQTPNGNDRVYTSLFQLHATGATPTMTVDGYAKYEAQSIGGIYSFGAADETLSRDDVRKQLIALGIPAKRITLNALAGYRSWHGTVSVDETHATRAIFDVLNQGKGKVLFTAFQRTCSPSQTTLRAALADAEERARLIADEIGARIDTARPRSIIVTSGYRDCVLPGHVNRTPAMPGDLSVPDPYDAPVPEHGSAVGPRSIGRVTVRVSLPFISLPTRAPQRAPANDLALRPGEGLYPVLRAAGNENAVTYGSGDVKSEAHIDRDLAVTHFGFRVDGADRSQISGLISLDPNYDLWNDSGDLHLAGVGKLADASSAVMQALLSGKNAARERVLIAPERADCAAGSTQIAADAILSAASTAPRGHDWSRLVNITVVGPMTTLGSCRLDDQVSGKRVSTIEDFHHATQSIQVGAFARITYRSKRL